MNSILFLSLSFNNLPGILIGILGFIVAFGLAVFIHELGHFLAAKAFKVPVERFVIGFDKEAMPFLPGCIWEKKIGDTVYGIALMPLGGYVKMSGVVHPDIERYLEGEDDKKPKPLKAAEVRPDGVVSRDAGKSNTLQGQALQDMAALYKKPFWQKIIIYGAGVTMNIVLAMGVIALLFAKGFQVDAPMPARIAWVAPESTYSGVLQQDDRMVSINGFPVETDEDFWKMFGELRLENREGGPENRFSFVFHRESASGEPQVITLERTWEQLTIAEGTERYLDPQFQMLLFRQPAYVEFVVPNDPADKAGVRAGDTIVAINDTPVEDWTHFRYLVFASPEKPLDFHIKRDDGMTTVTVTPINDPGNTGRGLVGIMPGNPDKLLNKEPLLTAVARAPGRTMDRTIFYLKNLKRLGGHLTTGNVAAVRRELGGPVGIAQMAYRQAQRGLDDWLSFLIALNIALAVMNILPVPVLDGGHICFAIYEAIFRKPVPPQVIVPLLNGAVVFVLIFFVLVTFNDVLKIFG